MRTAFEILPASINADNCTLLCEFSTEGFSYAIKDDASNCFVSLGVYHFDKTTPDVGFPIALQIHFHQHPLLAKNFNKTVVSYSLPQSVFIPGSIYDQQQNSNVLNLIHGDLHNGDIILNDFIEKDRIYNCYRVPGTVFEVFGTQFQNVVNLHQYSVLMNHAAGEQDQLRVIFYTQKIVVSLIKDGKHQLINSFNYSTPEDVAYTLLNITEQFNVKDIGLSLGGLIEHNSSLYKAIYKYFSSVELALLPGEANYDEEILRYPSQYFSHIFAIDSCE